MDMRDKEFDRVFNQKFEDFEVQPSPMVWNNIATQLDGKKAARSIMPWLSIAATVLIVATAGLLFLRKDNPMGQPKTKNKVAVSHIEPVLHANKPAGLVVVTKPAKVIASTASHKHNSSTPIDNNLTLGTVTPADIIDHEPLISTQPAIATITDPASTKVQATLPDVQLVPRILNTVPQAQTEKSVIASIDKQSTLPVKKRTIRSMGDLINALVAQVDKRDDKLIEFSDGDDGDDNSTTVTGVNLGLIKIKKQ
jgi:hypothetical protein